MLFPPSDRDQALHAAPWLTDAGRQRRKLLRLSTAGLGAAVGLIATGCASDPRTRGTATESPRADQPVRLARPATAGRGGRIDDAALLRRIGWGPDRASLARIDQLGPGRWLQHQLHPDAPASVPDAIAPRIDAPPTDQASLEELIGQLEPLRQAAGMQSDDEAKARAVKTYQQALAEQARHAHARFWWTAIHSDQQLGSQMTWFWLNHFSVFEGKANLRAMVGDYEARAIRPHALGRFHDLVLATLRHPAMLRYLDNEQNAANRINENYARELMELHTLGVDGGYGQRDVQELARVLTGAGIFRPGAERPRMRPVLERFYQREGLFEFNPNRHDFNDKLLLGAIVPGQGMDEIEAAVLRLCDHPATARHVSRKLARYFLGDEPGPALLDHLAHSFQAGRGDIAFVLRELFETPDFADSLVTGAFKDPARYLMSSLRMAFDQMPIVDMRPVLAWMQRLGEPLFGRSTPDGYPLDQASWSGAAQMSARFDIARAIGSGPLGLFREEGAESDGPRPRFSRLSGPVFQRALEPSLSKATRQALDQANSTQEWNTLLLASPEMMRC
ncbi:MAG: DUF1800 domain-containing protein [Burkholderiaceae bacterium]